MSWRKVIFRQHAIFDDPRSQGLLHFTNVNLRSLESLVVNYVVSLPFRWAQSLDLWDGGEGGNRTRAYRFCKPVHYHFATSPGALCARENLVRVWGMSTG